MRSILAAAIGGTPIGIPISSWDLYPVLSILLVVFVFVTRMLGRDIFMAVLVFVEGFAVMRLTVFGIVVMFGIVVLFVLRITRPVVIIGSNVDTLVGLIIFRPVSVAVEDRAVSISILHPAETVLS